MELYRCTKCKYSQDLSGFGAFKYGGRWNSPGTYIVYTASNPSLALLETLVHMNPMMPGQDFCLMQITVDTDSVLTIPPDKLITNWQSAPGAHLLRSIGDQFVVESRYLLLKVPSVILPMEWNFLINPRHPLASSLRLSAPAPLQIDQRLIPAKTS